MGLIPMYLCKPDFPIFILDQSFSFEFAPVTMSKLTIQIMADVHAIPFGNHLNISWITDSFVVHRSLPVSITSCQVYHNEEGGYDHKRSQLRSLSQWGVGAK